MLHMFHTERRPAGWGGGLAGHQSEVKLGCTDVEGLKNVCHAIPERTSHGKPKKTLC